MLILALWIHRLVWISACSGGRCRLCLKELHLSVEVAGVPRCMEQVYEGLRLS